MVCRLYLNSDNYCERKMFCKHTNEFPCLLKYLLHLEKYYEYEQNKICEAKV